MYGKGNGAQLSACKQSITWMRRMDHSNVFVTPGACHIISECKPQTLLIIGHTT